MRGACSCFQLPSDCSEPTTWIDSPSARPQSLLRRGLYNFTAARD